MRRLLPLLLVACGEDITWVDPDVTLSNDRDGRAAPTELVLGYRDGNTFTPIADLARLPVVDGLQGGTWTMPTLRIASLAPSLAVLCTLSTTAGEALGQTQLQVPTRPATTSPHGGPGWVEVADLPIPVTHAPPRATEPITDLEGNPATLTCTVSAAGVAVTTEATAPLDVP